MTITARRAWLTALVGAATASLAAPAAAQDRADDGKGFYLAARLGSAGTSDVDLTYYGPKGAFGGTGASDSASFKADIGGALAVGGTLGYDFGTLRFDVDVDYQRSKVRALTVTSLNGAPVTLGAASGAAVCDELDVAGCSVDGNTIRFDGSHLRQVTALANLWVDLPVGRTIVPYVGGGVGVGGYQVDGDGTARFAWQLGAGVAVNVTPHVALTVDYRHRQIGGATVADEDDDAYGTIVGKVKSDTISAGLRFRF